MKMECNKEEAIRAKDLAEKKMQNKDFMGARKTALKAQQLFPDLENISQLLTVCEVHCSAGVKVNGEMDWYRILQVEATADESSIKKQYRKLALQLHPDKNQFAGAEAAFKLIGEANLTLSDKLKRYTYDIKRNANIKTAQTRQPSQQSRKTSCARNFSNVNFNGLNQQQHQQSAFSASQTFWTMCPACAMRYQYFRTILYKSLRCQNCLKPFVAIELSAKVAPSGANSGHQWSNFGNPTSQIPVPQDSNINQQNQPGNVPSNMGLHGNVGERPGVKVDVKAGATNEVQFENVYSKEMNQREMAAKTSNANANLKRRKVILKSSDSDSTGDEVIDPTAKQYANTSAPRRSTRRKQNVIYKEDGSDNDDVDDEFVNSPNKKSKGESSGNAYRHDESLFHRDSDTINLGVNKLGLANAKITNKLKDILHEEKLPNGNEVVDKDVVQKSKKGISMKEEKSEQGSESKADSSSKMSPLQHQTFNYPDPEFFDFDNVRTASHFAVDQIWAIYDNLDGMPRFYARIRKIEDADFRLRFTWLEHNSSNEAEMMWCEEDLPVASGKYKLGKSEYTEDRLMFSHIVSWQKGKRKNSYDVYPRQGDVWALFKDWDIGWRFDAEKYRLYEYEVVEVLSNFSKGTGISVIPLVKIEGFVSLFMRAEADPVVIPPSESLRFSHNVPHYRLTGTEREGVPEGSLELDCAALPENFAQVFPSVSLGRGTGRVGKADGCTGTFTKITSDNMEPETSSAQEIENKRIEGLFSDWVNEADDLRKNEASKPEHQDQVNTETKHPEVLINENSTVDGGDKNNEHADQNDNLDHSASGPSVYEFPETEFHNFEESKRIEDFQSGQVWALYSDIDKYPKYYGYVNNVELEKGLVHTAWLEAYPEHEEEKRWLEVDMPISCGTFIVAPESVVFDTTDTFSHIVPAKQCDARNQYVILPSAGEIWAMYKNWKVGWNPSDLEICAYDVVEICEATGSGMKVGLLEKVAGYRAVFKLETNGKAVRTMEIPADEYIRFSHQIPAFLLTEERGGKLRGCWELDTASVPEHLLF